MKVGFNDTKGRFTRYFVTNFYWVRDEVKCSCVKMADELVVDWFIWRRFSKSTERIKAKNISLESFFNAQDS